MKIVIVMTEPLIVQQLMKGQLNWLVKKGHEVIVVCNRNGNLKWLKDQGVRIIQVDFRRNISLFYDFKSLLQLIKVLRKLKADIIHYSTPKPSLLTPLAIKFGFIKARIIYTVRGRIYENYKGIKKIFFEFIDFFSCTVAHKIIFISKEMMQDFLDNKIVKKNKAMVIGPGSSNGFNLNYFRKPSYKEKIFAKKLFKVKNFTKIIIFLGRIHPDKGIEDLLYVFRKLQVNDQNIGLLLIGNLEMNLNQLLYKMNINKKKIKIFRWTDKTRNAFWASDVLVFPSYREGFGNVCVESILSGIPVVSYNIIGCRESVKNNTSGYLVPFKDKEKLFKKVQKILYNKNVNKLLSKKGQIWAKSRFDEKKIWNGILKTYVD